MGQLDLFGITVVEQPSRQFDEPQPQKEKELIEVFTFCKVCGPSNHLGPHVPVHTKEYMEKNWENIGDGKWAVYGLCSRQCEIKFNNQKHSSP